MNMKGKSKACFIWDYCRLIFTGFFCITFSLNAAQADGGRIIQEDARQRAEQLSPDDRDVAELRILLDLAAAKGGYSFGFRRREAELVFFGKAQNGPIANIKAYKKGSLASFILNGIFSEEEVLVEASVLIAKGDEVARAVRMMACGNE